MPPPPGSRPSITSGNPNAVLESFTAILYLQARAVSRPPPRQLPWIAATYGFREDSILLNNSWPVKTTQYLVLV